ncbi:hypothetical protein B0H66DRAFT_10246 [Apodospora peruviana]|uniref:Uncharacterized protein n=1 Tax=Apodospora peruviana TaxID=516989 RepID=A0AAE0IPY8_9PEZI|nr:hypothetical protein B0H66DRAFT_10246 [Apodospora peruviana]
MSRVLFYTVAWPVRSGGDPCPLRRDCCQRASSVPGPPGPHSSRASRAAGVPRGGRAALGQPQGSPNFTADPRTASRLVLSLHLPCLAPSLISNFATKTTVSFHFLPPSQHRAKTQPLRRASLSRSWFSEFNIPPTTNYSCRPPHRSPQTLPVMLVPTTPEGCGGTARYPTASGEPFIYLSREVSTAHLLEHLSSSWRDVVACAVV